MKLRPWITGPCAAVAAAAALLMTQAALAHGTKAGDIAIDHPYSTPTPPGARTGALYFRRLTNTGASADRLRSATTPVARVVEFHEMRMDGDIMRMRAIPALELPAKVELTVRHGGTLHLMLVDLKQPLKEGDRFPVTLEFERAGKQEVMAWVQQPRGTAAPEHDAHAR
jgi:hypothetical protein